MLRVDNLGQIKNWRSNYEKKFIIILVILFIIVIAIMFRIHYVNKIRGRCLHSTGGCDFETMICVDDTTSCDFKESINYYFFK